MSYEYISSIPILAKNAQSGVSNFRPMLTDFEPLLSEASDAKSVMQ